MKQIILFFGIIFLVNILYGQTKTNGILGYTMDPDNKGDKQTISLIGTMENSIVDFQMSFQSGNPISSVAFILSDPNPNNTLYIKINGAVVFGLKQFSSEYSSGIFKVSPSGTVYTEVKIKFKSIFLEKNADQPKNNIQNINPLKSGTTQSWMIQSDPTIKGIGGIITMQIPKQIGFHTHMEFFNADDNKKVVASWFGNNTAKLLPGNYNILVDKKYTIYNVPVELGKQTRLKMGVFKIGGFGTFTLENSDHNKFSYGAPVSIILPEGTYHMMDKKLTPIYIKDGELTEL